MHAHDCPKCGMPDSCYGERFCGKCEEQYLTERERELKESYQAYLDRLPEDAEFVFTWAEWCKEDF